MGRAPEVSLTMLLFAFGEAGRVGEAHSLTARNEPLQWE